MSEFLEMSESDIGSLTQETAKIKIDSVMRDARDDTNHPYLNRHSPDHKRAVEIMQKFHTIANPQPGAQQTAEGDELVNQLSAETTEVMSEALDLKENRDAKTQAKLIKEAEAEMDKLVGLGFDRDPVPENISEEQVDGLRMQRMTADQDFLNLVPLLSKQLKSLNVPNTIQDQFAIFCNSSDLDLTLKQDISEAIIKWIYQARKEQTKKAKQRSEKPKPKTHRPDRIPKTSPFG